MEASLDSVPAVSRRLQAADRLHHAARWIFWGLAAGVLGVTPWLFGGNSSEGYRFIVWGGRLCLLPLLLWGVACCLRKSAPGAEFWVPLACWSLLTLQIVSSTYNRSSAPVAPWLGNGFNALPHDPLWPSTAFKQATQLEGWFWLSLGLIAFTARNVGLVLTQLRSLLWLMVGTATTLALVGLPFKFSGQMLVLGKWPAPEWYFYSTFLYHNHWCAFALLAVALVVALFEDTSSLPVRGALGVAGGVIAASAPLSTSRLGTLAMALFGVGVIVRVVLRSRGTKVKTHSKTLPVLAGFALLGLLVFGACTLYFYKSRGGPGGHRTWSGVLTANPFGIRQTLAEDTLPMIADKPWFGWGLGGYGGAFRFYQRPETRVVHNSGRITLYDHPHNDWLERLAELGVVGFSLFLTPGVTWVWMAARRGFRFELQRWVLFGCLGLLVFAIGDMVFVNRAVAAAFALFLPLAVRPQHRRRIAK
jgi:O-antigen ligase